MEKAIKKEWKVFKEELENNLKEAIDRNNVDPEVLKMMVAMLDRSKLKNRRSKQKEKR